MELRRQNGSPDWFILISFLLLFTISCLFLQLKAADVLCCTASILNLCAISVDRYQAITAPFDYAARSTPRRMIAVIFGVWLGSACVSLPPVLLLGNEHINPEGGSTCSVSQNSWYQIYATMASFYVPLFVMVFVYFKILRVVADKKKEMTWKPPNSNNCVCSSTPLQPQFANSTIPALVKFSPPLQPKLLGQSMTMTTLTHKGSNSTTSSTTTTTSALGGIHKPSIGSVAGEGKRSGENGGLLGRNSITNLPPVNNSASNGASKFLIPSVAIRVKKDRLFSGLKEHKASTTLGIIMSAFIICWLPFFVLALARPISNWDIPRWVSSLFNWLGYANSALNPVIYATLNRDFRLPFKEILCFRCGTLDSLMRKRYYKDQYGDDTENPEFSRNKRSFPMDSEGEVQPTNL